VRIVEVAGPIGAGKSSITIPLVQALRERGVAASRLDDMGRPGRAAAAAWSAAFVLRHPGVCLAVGQAVIRAPLPWWHRRLIFGLAIGVGGRLMLAATTATAHQCVVVDEGLLHRSVNLYAWRIAIPTDDIRSYVASLPIDGEILLVITASSDLAARRVATRGLPKRLVGRPQSEVRAFSSRARDIVLLAADCAEERGVPVIRVNNSRSLRMAVKAAADGIARVVERPHGPVHVVAERWAPVFPVAMRPDRVLRTKGRGPSPSVSAPVVREVLTAYGLAQAGRPRRLSSPTARGDSLRVRTTGGEVVVKRYKPTVAASAVAVEHSVLAELERLQFPAPRLRRRPGAGSSLELDGLQYAVFGFLAGFRDPRDFFMAPSDRRRVDLMAAATLAELHLALAHHTPPASDSLGFIRRGGQRARPVEWYVEELTSLPAPRRVRAWLETALWRTWERLDREQPPLTVIHGDYGRHNLLVKRGARLVVVDFELARLDWRAADLAIALPRFADRRLGFHIDRAREFLAVYRQRTGATLAELRLVPDILAYLSLQRAVIAWGRERDGVAGDWGAEARQRVMAAEQLFAGQHPLNAVVTP
jgi:Ser/Thr protein kinase RdoA (MazF antagonist)